MRRRLVGAVAIVGLIVLIVTTLRCGDETAIASPDLEAAPSPTPALDDVARIGPQDTSTPLALKPPPPLDPSQATRVTFFVHANGTALAKAVVKVWAFGAGDFTVTTDDEGHAELDLPPGEWRAEAALDNYRSQYGLPLIRTTAGGEAIETAITMEPLSWVEGIVVDEEDRPLEGATVSNRDGKTDAQGHFRVSLTDDIPMLRVRLEGYASLSVFLPGLADAGFQHIVLKRERAATTGRVTGLVLTENGAPAGGAMLSCTGEDDAGRTSRSKFSDANDAGRFEVMCGAPRGTLSAYSVGNGSTRLEVSEGDDVTLRLPGARSITVRAVDDSGLAITQLRMRSNNYMRDDLHSADGTFEFKYFEPQKYELRFSTAKCATEITRDVDLSAGSLNLGTLVFSRGAALRGVVVDQNGLGIAGVRLHGSGADVFTNSRGVFELFLAPGSRIELDVVRAGFISKYVTIESARQELRIVLSASGDAGLEREFGGIGMSTVDGERDGGMGFEVVEVFEGRPASEAGILVGDEVIAVDGARVRPGSHAAFLTRVRGPVDSVVQLTIQREGRIFDVRITRKTIRY